MGGLRGMLKECVDILKWQWENNEGLLIGGWEPHRNVASHRLWSLHGGMCMKICHWITKKNLERAEVSWLWTVCMHRNSEPTCGQFQCFRICFDSKVTVKVALEKILSTDLVIFLVQGMELTMNIMIIWVRLIMPRKRLALELLMRGHLSCAVLSLLRRSLWIFTARGRGGEKFIYSHRHMTNRRGEIFIWEQHAGKWRE